MLEKLRELFQRLEHEVTHFNNHLNDPGFINHCMRIVESGWQAEFDTIDALKPFMITADPIANLFTRRYLLKLLSEAYTSNRLENFDRDWYEAAEKNLDYEYTQFVADTWPDTLCKLEPTAVVIAFMAYFSMFASNNPNRLLILFLAIGTPLYMALTGTLNVMPSIASSIRSNFFISRDMRDTERRSAALYDVMSYPHRRDHIQSWFSPSPENHQTLLQREPLSLLSRVSALHDELVAQTQQFSANFQRADFVKACFALIENGWDEQLNETELFIPFKPNNLLDGLLKRLYLLKLLSESNNDPERCAPAQEVLLNKIGQHMEGSIRALRYQGHDVRTHEDLTVFEREGRTQFNRFQPVLHLGSTAILLDFILKKIMQNPVAGAFLFSVVVTGNLALMQYFYRQSDRGQRTLFFVDDARSRIDRNSPTLLLQPDFRHRFLANHNAAIQPERHQNAADVHDSYVTANSIKALLSGVSLMVLGGALAGGPRSVSFWMGFLLMAMSILYYNPQNANIYRRMHESSRK